ncbi:1491_t:CDS:2, partial [Cetraspora pellucida]
PERQSTKKINQEYIQNPVRYYEKDELNISIDKSKIFKYN